MSLIVDPVYVGGGGGWVELEILENQASLRSAWNNFVISYQISMNKTILEIENSRGWSKSLHQDM